MKTKSNNIIMQNKVFFWLALGTAFILLIPLITMQFTSKINWSLSDFIIMGVLIFGMGSTYVFVARKTSKYRVIIGIALFIAFILTWAELAVGLFGTPFAGS